MNTDDIHWVKGYYYFDCMFNMRLAKVWIRKGHFSGWEELHEVLQKRKEFHLKIQKLKWKQQ